MRARSITLTFAPVTDLAFGTLHHRVNYCSLVSQVVDVFAEESRGRVDGRLGANIELGGTVKIVPNGILARQLALPADKDEVYSLVSQAIRRALSEPNWTEIFDREAAREGEQFRRVFSEIPISSIVTSVEIEV